MCFFFFFFKQKTAYELRISDWSSDVCSSDLIEDACTVFEFNYMSNIAPQLHSRFNGSGGLWYKLETRIRERVAGKGKSVHIIAGTVFGDGDAHVVGPDEDIFVPHMFYQIIISEHGARSEEHTSELQSLMRISYAVFCLKK